MIITILLIITMIVLIIKILIIVELNEGSFGCRICCVEILLCTHASVTDHMFVLLVSKYGVQNQVKDQYCFCAWAPRNGGGWDKKKLDPPWNILCVCVCVF